MLWKVKKSMSVIISSISCFFSDGINYSIGMLMAIFISVLIIFNFRWWCVVL